MKKKPKTLPIKKISEALKSSGSSIMMLADYQKLGEKAEEFVEQMNGLSLHLQKQMLEHLNVHAEKYGVKIEIKTILVTKTIRNKRGK